MAIILEGPDGAGKTTLLKNLLIAFPQLQPMPRFATSEGGPVAQGDDLFWLARSQSQKVIAEHPQAVYDRHPMFSEYVYRAIIPRPLSDELGVSEAFLSEEAQVFNEIIAKRSLVIFCLPGYAQAMKNLGSEPQMAGVLENYSKIYDAYRERYATYTGMSIRYNYQDPSSFNLAKIVTYNYLRGATV